MATKLFLRNTHLNGIGPTYYDMVTTAGSSADTTFSVTNTTSGGTEIQCTKTAGGAVVQWVSGPTPSAGFTLTTTDINIWALESNALANTGGRYRLFKRSAAGVETELAGGAYDDGVEFGTANTAMTWVGNPTDTAFAENDRLLLKVYLTNIGTMGASRTATITINAASAATGDSFLNLADTVTFKADAPNPLNVDPVVIRRAGLPLAVLVAAGCVLPPPQIAPVGSGDVLFSQSQTVVPHQRAIVYQSLFQPVPVVTAAETITVDKWFAPLSQPVRRQFTVQGSTVFVHAPAAAVPGSGDVLFAASSNVTPHQKSVLYQSLFQPVPIATASETVTVDKWFKPLSQPRPDVYQSVDIGTTSFAIEPSFDWYRPWELPTRRKIAGSSTITFVPSGAAGGGTPGNGDVLFNSVSAIVPYTKTTLYQSLFQPVPVIAAAAETITVDKWYRPLAEPPRRKAVGYSTLAFVPVVVAGAETVTVDKWFRALSQPLPPSYASIDIGVTSFAVEPSFDWYRPWVNPVRRKTAGYSTITFVPSGEAGVVVGSPGNGDVLFNSVSAIVPHVKTTLYPSLFQPVPVIATAPETITLDKWYRPLAEPARRKPQSYQATFTPPDTSIPSFGWYRAFSTPPGARTAPLGLTAFVPVVATPTPGSGDVLFTSCTAIVPYQRAILYQSLFVPIPPDEDDQGENDQGGPWPHGHQGYSHRGYGGRYVNALDLAHRKASIARYYERLKKVAEAEKAPPVPPTAIPAPVKAIEPVKPPEWLQEIVDSIWPDIQQAKSAAAEKELQRIMAEMAQEDEDAIALLLLSL